MGGDISHSGHELEEFLNKAEGPIETLAVIVGAVIGFFLGPQLVPPSPSSTTEIGLAFLAFSAMVGGGLGLAASRGLRAWLAQRKAGRQ